MRSKLSDIFVDKRIVFSLILLLTVVIFVDAMPGLSLGVRSVLFIIQATISIFFVGEIFFRIRREGWRSYFSSSLNVADFLIVLLGAACLLFPAAAFTSLGYLRIVRLVSLIRLLKILPNSGHIFRGLIRAIKASRAVFAMLLAILFLFAMIGHSLFSHQMAEHFGDPLTSIMTVFSIFTVENWNEIPEQALATSESLYFAVNSYVVIVLVVGGFFALSLANAVFVDEMVTDNNDSLHEKIDELLAQNSYQQKQLHRLQQQVDLYIKKDDLALRDDSL